MSSGRSSVLVVPILGICLLGTTTSLVSQQPDAPPRAPASGNTQPVAPAADPAGVMAPLMVNRVVKVQVAAIDQPVAFNRLGSMNPTGMIYALLRDVVPTD